MSTGTAGDRAGYAGLPVLCAGLFMVWLDITIVNVALPDIQADLNASVSDLEWVLSTYTLAFGCLMLIAGGAGDRYGRKPIFVAGIAVFTFASAACALSETVTQLHTARLLQGAAGAVVMPSSLSIIAAAFPDAGGRARAVGIWSGVGSLGLAGGPVIGGLLVTGFGWASIFWINVPIGVLTCLAGSRLLSNSRAATPARLDLVGLATFTAAIALLTYGLIESASSGWSSPRVIWTLVASVAAAASFVVSQVRSDSPVIPRGLFRHPEFALPNLAGAVTFFGLFGVLLFLSVFLQAFVGLTALETGLRFLPTTLAMAVTAPIAGAITARLGARLPLSVGCFLSGVGLLLLTRVTTDSTYADYAVPFVLLGAGTTLAVTPGTIAVLHAVISDRSGAASGLNQTARQVGGVLGIAVLSTIIVQQFAARLPAAVRELPIPPPTPEQARELLDGGLLGGQSSPPTFPVSPALVEAAGDAFAEAVHTAMVVAGGLDLLAGLAVLLLMSRRSTALSSTGRRAGPATPRAARPS
jgi:EmrB/QacA subfamily drug resistance transporter